MKPGKKGISRIVAATGYSMKGLKAAWINEAAFRQESVLLVIAVLITYLLPVGIVERVLLISSVALVLIVELVNSAIEAEIGRASCRERVSSPV